MRGSPACAGHEDRGVEEHSLNSMPLDIVDAHLQRKSTGGFMQVSRVALDQVVATVQSLPTQLADGRAPRDQRGDQATNDFPNRGPHTSVSTSQTVLAILPRMSDESLRTTRAKSESLLCSVLLAGLTNHVLTIG